MAIRWTDSDNLRSREAAVVGGPNHGLVIAVANGSKGQRFPDVFDMTGYVFDPEAWAFKFTSSPS